MSCDLIAIDNGTLFPTFGKSEETLTLVAKSADNCVEIKLSIEAAKACETLKDSIENDFGEEKIVVPNISPQTLPLVVNFLEQLHLDTSPKDPTCVSAWERQFCDVSDEQLFDLLIAGDYLACQRLIDVSAFCIAEECKGKSSEQICERFNIRIDITAQEMARIKKEMDWLD